MRLPERLRLEVVPEQKRNGNRIDYAAASAVSPARAAAVMARRGGASPGKRGGGRSYRVLPGMGPGGIKICRGFDYDPAIDYRRRPVRKEVGKLAGIGPITTNRKDLLRRAGVRPAISSPANELEIYCSLCVGRVYFREETRTLYFVDSPALSVSEIVQQVFKGLAQTPGIRQLYMDEHNLFRAAYSIELTPAQRKPLFIALRLAGIHINRSAAKLGRQA